jgi:hypothetical protein
MICNLYWRLLIHGRQKSIVIRLAFLLVVLCCNMLVATILFTQWITSTFFQNKILHSQLEALHIQWAEKERNAAGISPGSSGDTFADVGLQNVVNYLRRSKEIVNTLVFLLFSLSFSCKLIFGFVNTIFLISQAETEVSLLKQEKLRLQSQVIFVHRLFHYISLCTSWKK